MARSVYIASLEGHSGKSLIALGILDALIGTVRRIGVFRPVTRSDDGDDHVLRLLLEHDGVDLAYHDCIGATYDQVHTDPEAALQQILTRYRAIEAETEAVIVVGSDYTDAASAAIRPASAPNSSRPRRIRSGVGTSPSSPDPSVASTTSCW